MSEDSIDEKQKGKGCLIAVVLFVLPSPMWYLLSAGPGAFLATRLPKPFSTLVSVFFRPVSDWLIDGTPRGPIEQAYEDYLIW